MTIPAKVSCSCLQKCANAFRTDRGRRVINVSLVFGRMYWTWHALPADRSSDAIQVYTRCSISCMEISIFLAYVNIKFNLITEKIDCCFVSGFGSKISAKVSLVLSAVIAFSDPIRFVVLFQVFVICCFTNFIDQHNQSAIYTYIENPGETRVTVGSVYRG